jgi:hypothetical protein
VRQSQALSPGSAGGHKCGDESDGQEFGYTLSTVTPVEAN